MLIANIKLVQPQYKDKNNEGRVELECKNRKQANY